MPVSGIRRLGRAIKIGYNRKGRKRVGKAVDAFISPAGQITAAAGAFLGDRAIKKRYERRTGKKVKGWGDTLKAYGLKSNKSIRGRRR